MASPPKSASIARKPIPPKHISLEPVALADSGYYGSQSQDNAGNIDEVMEDTEPTKSASSERVSERQAQTATAEEVLFQVKPTSGTNSFEEIFEAEQGEQIKTANTASPAPLIHDDPEIGTVPSSSPVQLLGSESPEKSPAKSPPPQAQLEQPEQPEMLISDQQARPGSAHEADPMDVNGADVARSPSDGSSPIRPMVRKSSLNFASLPAREPLTSNKSLGARMSRTSHIDQTRTSYYPRNTGGKSLGARQDALEDDEDVMDVDEDEAAEHAEDKTQNIFAIHNKTYTQRLQDQISMLGKSQAAGNRPSKSIANLAGTQQSLFTAHAQNPQQARPAQEEQPRSPPRYHQLIKTPGAFPEDEEEDWIAPPTAKQTASQSPRPGTGQSHTAEIMEGFHSKNTFGGVDFDLPRDQPQNSLQESLRYSPKKLPPLSYQSTSELGHGKSILVPDLSGKNNFEDVSEQATISTTPTTKNVSNLLTECPQNTEVTELLKSPSRSFRESPLRQNALKQVKNKFSSILKGSKGLLASSAALSAEGKASLVNSPSTRLRDQNTKSAESLAPQKEEEPLYPDLTKHMPSDSHPAPSPPSPSTLSNTRKTRASAEQDKRDQKQKEKEEKEVQHLAEQMEKLEKAREREREKARVFSMEREEKMAAEKQFSLQKEHENDTRTPAPKEAMKPSRTSPRKAQAQIEAEARAAEDMAEAGVAYQDVGMADIPTSKPAPPSIPRPTPGQTLRAREVKRPLKPTRDVAVKPKQAPTLIRVNTSSQHSGFHPSNSVLAATLQETLGNSQQQAKMKTGQSSIQTKTSSQSLKSSVSSTTGRPKALELAEKRRQEEEKKAQRKRDLKAEMERKREEDRRQEEERREKERQRAAAEEETRKVVARQAAIEKAKQTKAPPPAIRSQPHAPPAAVSRPPSRLGQSTMHRSQEDVSRPVKAVLSSSTAKMSMKRPLQQESTEDAAQRPTGARSGPSQQKEFKRMRMSDEFDPEEEAEIQSYGSSIKGPPVRPSTGFKKVSCAREISFPYRGECLLTSQDAHNKSLFSGGYAPAPQGVTRDIFKAPVTSHHSKSGHPLDMAQVSKGHIPFASSQHGAGPSHKTPARPAGVMAAKSAAKSATRSSPRFQNGENIELPEIQTDDDDDDDDEDEHKSLGVASWADTPELRRELMKQETVDPLQVFGPPAPLKLEEVFKNKDRWSKFRARTSSANWAGTDRLTEDEIRKDLAAREKMRRDGGWSYELSRDMA